jgi:hypothetical protein
MIGLRVSCDAAGCERHFNLDGQVDLDPRPMTGLREQRFVVFGVPFVALPGGWAASLDPGLRLLCAEHAPTGEA